MTAVSSFNFCPDYIYIRKMHKTATKQSPGELTKLYIRNLQKDKLNSQNRKKSKLNFETFTSFTYIVFK